MVISKLLMAKVTHKDIIQYVYRIVILTDMVRDISSYFNLIPGQGSGVQNISCFPDYLLYFISRILGKFPFMKDNSYFNIFFRVENTKYFVTIDKNKRFTLYVVILYRTC